MNKATKTLAMTLGIIASIMGIEHGIGEVLQGSREISETFILSWPDTDFFKIFGGEPALTLFHSYSTAGIFSILFSLGYFLVFIKFMGKRIGVIFQCIFIIAMLLSGAGFGPPFVGLIACFISFKIHSNLKLWSRIPERVHAIFTAMWPFAYFTCMAGWLALFPGAPVISLITGSYSIFIMLIPLTVAFIMIPMTLLFGFSKDLKNKAA